MVKKTQLLACIFMLLSHHLLSQDISEEKPKLKNEIAIDLSPIMGGIVKQNGLPGIFYRRHFGDCAFRAKVNFSFDKGNTDNSSFSSTNNFGSSPQKNENDFFQIDYSIGIQRGRNISEKWIFYYGADLFSGYSSSTNSYTSKQQGYDPMSGITYTTTNTQKNENMSIFWGVSPFFGFTWKIADRLGLSVEAASSLGYYETDSERRLFTPSTNFTPESDIRGESNSTNFRARLLPLSNLVMSYYF